MAWAESTCPLHDLRNAIYFRYTPCQFYKFMLVKAKSRVASTGNRICSVSKTVLQMRRVSSDVYMLRCFYNGYLLQSGP